MLLLISVVAELAQSLRFSVCDRVISDSVKQLQGGSTSGGGWLLGEYNPHYQLLA